MLVFFLFFCWFFGFWFLKKRRVFEWCYNILGELIKSWLIYVIFFVDGCFLYWYVLFNKEINYINKVNSNLVYLKVG